MSQIDVYAWADWVTVEACHVDFATGYLVVLLASRKLSGVIVKGW